MSRCSLILAVSILVFCIAPEGIAVDGDLEHLVSPELLKRAELRILWENKLPIKKGERLERLFILGNRIYGLSDRNFMCSLNREKGNMIFGVSIAESGFPVIGFGLYKDGLFAVAGNRLVEIDPDSGMKRRAKRLRFIAACPAVRNELNFYIAGTDKRIHALRSKDKVQVFETAAESDSMITSVVADENSVFFATTAGDVVSITADRSKRLWQFNAADSVARPIIKDNESLYVASKDTNIYKLNATTGELIWKYQTGAMLEKGPHVTENMVYQYVSDEGLSAIDKKSGKLLWQLSEGVDLLAEADGKSYVITRAGTLVVMDNKKARQVYSVDSSGVSRYAANVVDSKIYVADKDGRIACLSPIKY